MSIEIPTDKIQFISSKIKEVIDLSQELSPFDQGYIYLLDMADRLLLGCRERIKADCQKPEKNE